MHISTDFFPTAVRDEKGCIASDTVFTHEPTELMIVIDATQTILPYCIGINTASLSAFAYGGTPGYTYEWDDNVDLPQTTTTATALLAGTYTITVTDYKSCTASDTRDIDTITNTMGVQVSSLMQYVGGNDISCFEYNDGGAEVTAFGAHGPYTYQWFGGSSATTANIGNLYAGTYSIIVRDTNNCMVSGSIDLVEPSSLTFSVSVNTPESCLGACDGGVLVDGLAGGVAPYTALLTDNLTGSVSTHSIINDYILAVCSGSHTISLIDANNCPSSVIPGGVNQQVVGYDTITVAEIAVLTDTICHASSVGILNVFNPINSYSYSWENINNPGVVISTGVQVDSLSAGFYVLLADYNNTPGCTAADTIEMIEYLAITNTVTIDHVGCYGESTGSILVSASGTLPPYSYAWSLTDTAAFDTTALVSNLSAGSYALTVVDGNSCESIFTYNVTEPEVLIANVIKDGYILTAESSVGGTAPFSYSWREESTADITIGTGIVFTVTNNGAYYVKITDANGCTSESNSFQYTSPPPPPTSSWDCIIGQGCSDPGNGSGLYSSQAACNTACDVNAIDEASTGIALSIYPNPFKEETTVDFGRVVNQASVRLVDVFGKLIEEYNITNTDKHILKRENKSSGIYFVEIEVEQQEKMIYKLIIK